MTPTQSRRLTVIFVVLLISILPLAIGQSTAHGQPPDGTGDVPILTPEEAFEMAAEWYAGYFDASMDTARQALVLQHDAGELQAVLLSREKSVLGGLRIEHQPKLQVIISVIPGGEERILPYIPGSGVEDFVAIEIVEKTLAELAVDQSLAWQMMSEVGVKGASGMIGQRVKLYTPTPELLINALRDANLTLPETVDIVDEDLPVEDANFLAGFALTSGANCTSGFIGYHIASGDGGVFTAGHCGGGLNCCNFQFSHAQGQSLQFHVDYNAYSRDWQFNKNTTSHDLRSMINIGSTWLPVTGTTLRMSQTVGSIVCKYGKSTHYDCGVLYERVYKWEPLPGDPTIFNPTWMRVQKNGQTLTAAGDSGGPWFMPTGSPATVNAYGIHKGSQAYSSIYMAIDYIQPTHAIYTNCTPDWYC